MIMSEKKSYFYNEDSQVARCFADCFRMNEEEVNAQPALIIGFNGSEYLLSADWLITSKRDNAILGIMPFSMAPQYLGFTPVYSGVSYKTGRFGETLASEDDEPKERDAILIIGEKRIEFSEGQLLMIPVKDGETFISCDCEVTRVEQEKTGTSLFKVILNENTRYAAFKDGRVSGIANP